MVHGRTQSCILLVIGVVEGGADKGNENVQHNEIPIEKN